MLAGYQYQLMLPLKNLLRSQLDIASRTDGKKKFLGNRKFSKEQFTDGFLNLLEDKMILIRVLGDKITISCLSKLFMNIVIILSMSYQEFDYT